MVPVVAFMPQLPLIPTSSLEAISLHHFPPLWLGSGEWALSPISSSGCTIEPNPSLPMPLSWSILLSLACIKANTSKVPWKLQLITWLESECHLGIIMPRTGFWSAYTFIVEPWILSVWRGAMKERIEREWVQHQLALVTRCWRMP